jgi:hypothetical protein
MFPSQHHHVNAAHNSHVVIDVTMAVPSASFPHDGNRVSSNGMLPRTFKSFDRFQKLYGKFAPKSRASETPRAQLIKSSSIKAGRNFSYLTLRSRKQGNVEPPKSCRNKLKLRLRRPQTLDISGGSGAPRFSLAAREA